jgi:hypothetical protein
VTDQAAELTWHANLSYYRHKQQLECGRTWTRPCFARYPASLCLPAPRAAHVARRRAHPGPQRTPPPHLSQRMR